MTEQEYQELMQHSPGAFRLNRPPLYVFKLLRTEKALYLFMDFHHLIFDGFSVNLFLQDLAAELRGESCTQEKASYAGFALQQQKFLASEEVKDFDAYFGELFADYDSPSRLTPDLPKSEIPGKAARIQTEISQELVDKAVQRTGVSEAAFFLAVLDYVTARITNSDHVYISTISAGRNDVRFMDTYGMFVNTVPLASELGRGSVDAYIKDTAAGLSAAIEHEEYPFAQVADKWDYSVEVMYAYQRGLISQQGQQGEGLDMPGLRSVHEKNLAEPQFPLDVQIIDGENGPVIEIVYDDSLYSAEFITNVGRYCRTVIHRFAENGGQKLRRISLLDESEQLLLERFHTVPEEGTVSPDTFFFSDMEKFAAKYPERTALIAVDGTFSYGEFDRITDRMANALLKRGAKNVIAFWQSFCPGRRW